MTPGTSKHTERAVSLQAWLRGAPRVSTVEHHAVIDSTQRRAAEPPLRAGRVIVAAEQRAGYGRHGRAWHAPAGGLWLSWVLAPARAPTDGISLALLAALAARDALARCCGLECALRWPNDIVVGGRKLGGLLVDVRDRFAIVGLGLNVACTTAAFPPALAARTTSVVDQGVPAPALGRLARTFVERLDVLLVRWERGEDAALRTLLAAHMPVIGARVRHRAAARGPWRTGRVTALGARGELLLQPDDGPRPVPIYGGKVEIL